ncbi:hypothetical protein [Hyphomicrobium sp.]|uniref:hypothetical protein n=1 Tax=Hyphomicrobium sp. TaxID=82 RepID=UPI001DBA442C|nr:hypothetical protein [Hyphomicrobium sp.]MBY0562138.1 hypothetical protein [Hyphomicrobium sp.]
MEEFTPKNWFWIVAGDESKAWSSAAGAYVSEFSSGRVTRIANEVELFDVLSRLKLTAKGPSRTFTVEEVREALLRIDAEATGSASSAAELLAVAESIEFNLPPAL